MGRGQKGPEESWAEARGRLEAEMKRACGKTGGNGEGEQESCGNGVKRPAGRKEAGMNHPSAAYGKALMKRDNKGSTLDPVEPTNRHRSIRRQAWRILTS